jgi:hypothetical protein
MQSKILLLCSSAQRAKACARSAYYLALHFSAQQCAQLLSAQSIIYKLRSALYKQSKKRAAHAQKYASKQRAAQCFAIMQSASSAQLAAQRALFAAQLAAQIARIMRSI